MHFICSSASSLISSRDLNCDKSIEKLEKVNGNTQDLLKFLETTQNNVCLVIIDFTGLSTNTDDLKNFVRTFHKCFIICNNHKKLKKIIIDKLPFENETESITREIILENSSIVNLFNCRTNSNQRSKQI
ncbi:hypothetical protein EDC94DRAFT_646503 [Helicostylum pulchrum]|nr:hypothetical protein EDC94DRAFT_646503 [Helicostylum pulchrum]